MTGIDVYKIIGMYFAIVNLVGFLLMGIDKWKAKKRSFRIPEATLFITAGIGGALGCTIGMHLFRHKTRHWYFLFGMPAIFIVHVLLILFICKGPIQVIAF